MLGGNQYDGLVSHPRAMEVFLVATEIKDKRQHWWAFGSFSFSLGKLSMQNFLFLLVVHKSINNNLCFQICSSLVRGEWLMARYKINLIVSL